jgi:23S rRNA (adenine1618-N6)-methyltransferase
MLSPRKPYPSEKSILHPHSKHRGRYDFTQLTTACPELKPFVLVNKYGDESIDFFNPEAVRLLNKALLKHFYHVDYWELPKGYLCPSIPGRVDYIHYMADLIHQYSKNKKISSGHIRCLDIGVGASLIYPILGHKEYGWNFVGSDIDQGAIKAAQKIIDKNPGLNSKVEVRWQKNPKDYFRGIILPGETFDLTICNPPFHSSSADAQVAALRKLNNLKGVKSKQTILNFGGQDNELYCTGGELRFVTDMINESKSFATSCLWFSSLLSKQSNLKPILALLKKVEAAEVKTIAMGQGNKISRIVAWTFLQTPAF